jgi:hypothetical protein
VSKLGELLGESVSQIPSEFWLVVSAGALLTSLWSVELLSAGAGTHWKLGVNAQVTCPGAVCELWTSCASVSSASPMHGSHDVISSLWKQRSYWSWSLMWSRRKQLTGCTLWYKQEDSDKTSCAMKGTATDASLESLVCELQNDRRVTDGARMDKSIWLILLC